MGATAPINEVEVCNLALDRLGQKSISSIDSPVGSAEELCARHYHQTRRAVLRAFIFNFSRKLATLTASTTVTPAFGYSTAYALPNDFLRLLRIGEYADLVGVHEISDGCIYCDYGDTAGLDVRYIFDAKTVAKFDPLFVRVLALQLAMDMAYGFTLKQSLIQGIDGELKDARLAAAAVAGQENPPVRIQRSRLRDARRAGSGYRDNTRV